MRIALRAFIVEYQSQVASASQLLRERFGLSQLEWFSWKHVPQSGWLDDAHTIHYSFHGIGCCVEFGKVVVDFDFGPNGRYDGFDAWRLSQFARSIPTFSEFADTDTLDDELRESLNSAELVRDAGSFGSHLFYFRSADECE